MDEGRQPLSRKLPISSSKINPYRMIILLRIAILGLFFHYRILHPVNGAFGLWLTSVICEIWFAVSWILDQFPKWSPIVRETYLDRLSLRCNFSLYIIYIYIYIFSVLCRAFVDQRFCSGMRKKESHLGWPVWTYLSVQWIL